MQNHDSLFLSIDPAQSKPAQLETREILLDRPKQRVHIGLSRHVLLHGCVMYCYGTPMLNHGKLNPIFSLFCGAYFMGMFFRFTDMVCMKIGL